MHYDKFWKYFWSALGICIAVYVVATIGFLYLHSPSDLALKAAVGDSYDPTRDPFRKTAPDGSLEASDYLYRDSLSFGFEDWSWEVAVNWRSIQRHFEGSYSLSTEFKKPWSNVRANTPPIDLSPYASLSLSIYPESVADLYLELFDTGGNSLGRQSVGWYAQDGALVPYRWNVVKIPLGNLTATTSGVLPARKISGFSLSSEVAGVAFIDAVRLEKSVISHPRFEATASSTQL